MFNTKYNLPVFFEHFPDQSFSKSKCKNPGEKPKPRLVIAITP